MSERSEANDCVPFEILLCIYISIFIYIYEYIYVCPQHERRWQKRADYASGCCSSASFDDGCTLRYIALKLPARSSVSSAGGMQPEDWILP